MGVFPTGTNRWFFPSCNFSIEVVQSGFVKCLEKPPNIPSTTTIFIKKKQWRLTVICLRVWLEFSKNLLTLVTLEQIRRSYIFRSQMALQSVIKIDHTLLISISISILVVDQSLAHDQQKVIKRSNRSRSAIDHHKSGCTSKN